MFFVFVVLSQLEALSTSAGAVTLVRVYAERELSLLKDVLQSLKNL